MVLYHYQILLFTDNLGKQTVAAVKSRELLLQDLNFTSAGMDMWRALAVQSELHMIYSLLERMAQDEINVEEIDRKTGLSGSSLPPPPGVQVRDLLCLQLVRERGPLIAPVP